MKKKIFCILLGLMVLFFTSACSCSGTVEYTFDSRWTTSLSANYKEVCEYDVQYNDNYSLGGVTYAKSSFITDDIAKINYTNGKYTTTTTIITSAMYPSTLPKGDLLEDSQIKQSTIIKQEIDFSITANLALNGEEAKDYNDKVYSVTYFTMHDNGFAPLYSSYESKSTLLTVTESKADVLISENKAEYVYNKKDYTAKITATLDEDIKTIERTFDYTYKNLIDNNQLLFALRNNNIQKDSIISYNVNYMSYEGDKVGVNVKNLGELKLECKYGTEQKDITVNTNCYAFAIASSQSGINQVAYYQAEDAKYKDDANSIAYANRYHLVRYIEPLPVYGTYGLQGILEINLKNITIQG